MNSEETERYRHECEVLEIAKYPLAVRRAFLIEVEKQRGKAAADRLKESLTELWKEKGK